MMAAAKDPFDGTMLNRFKERTKLTGASTKRRYGDVDRDARKKLERHSVKTPGQRGRKKGNRTELHNFKTSPEMRNKLRGLAKTHGLSMTDVIEQGILLFEEKNGPADG